MNLLRKLLVFCALVVFAGRLVAAEPATPEEQKTVNNIKSAFSAGGPLISSWNVQAGWNLRKQVEWIKAGHHYYPTIWVPLTTQGANRENRWNTWYAENREALEFINRHKIPVTLRWHNWLNELTDVEPADRGPFELSPLVHGLRADGSLDSVPITDPFGPIEPWRVVGEGLGGSYWFARLAEVLYDVPFVYLLENNEGSVAEFGNYTEVLTGAGSKDAWGYRRRKWIDNLSSRSVRAAEYAKSHTVEEGEIALNRGYRERYEALTSGLFKTMPAIWRGKAYTGGYGGLGELSESGLLGRTFSYKRPQEDWGHSPWAPVIWHFSAPSARVYDDGSGSPFNWHDWVRGPHILHHNTAPLLRYLDKTRGEYWHDDRSWWISPQRCRAAAAEHGGYVLPDRAKGFARAVLWSVIANRRATVLRGFASSQTELSDQWFSSKNDPPELAHLTHGDYFASAMSAVDEVWNEPTLLMFWRDGVPVINPDPHFCRWELPSDVVDDRSRTLYTDADPPRFVGGIDQWRKVDGSMELKVFAQAWRMGSSTLVYAWSPRGVRNNVTVQIPGGEPMKFDVVDQDGEFKWIGGTGEHH